MASTQAEQVRHFVQQIEAAQTVIDDANADKTELYKAARQQGLSPKVLKRVIAERRKDPADRQQQDALFQQYWDMTHSQGVDTAPEKAHAPARTRDADLEDDEAA